MTWPDRAELVLPAWVEPLVRSWPNPETDGEAMARVASLARENVVRGSGGPFAAAVWVREGFEARSRPTLASVGVNLVTSASNSCAHAEVVAIMLAQKACGLAPLPKAGMRFELFTSCEPCAMCLGAVLWSGVKRLVCGATRSDAEAIGFDEGPVFAESYRYLEERGVQIVREVERAACVEALTIYQQGMGRIYNG